jgi:magnesium transporter
MSKRHRHSKIPKARRRHHIPAATLHSDFAVEGKPAEAIVHVTAYDANRVYDSQSADESELQKLALSWQVVWIDVEGLADTRAVEQVAGTFKIHPLIVEDILSDHQRAKIEQYGENFFLVTHLITEASAIEPKQLSLYIGKNYIVSFQNEPMDGLKSVRDRINENRGAIRTHGADYLTYVLIDAVIDSYFPVLERLGERLEELEDLVIENPTRESIAQIHIIKRELLILRRAIWPMREAINSLLRDATALIGEEARLHLRDSYDHAVRVLDFIETYREVGADLMDVYLSSVSNRMNEVMKVLTIITTIFAPPTFVAAIYGMNFDANASPYNMPETKWYYGYPIILLAMFVATGGIVTFLWWKGWLGVLTTGKTPHRLEDYKKG